MGCNFGDIDNDGFLDIYLGTGGMCYEYLVPNLMFKNVDGRRFEDVTSSSGTGHLQKGHGVSFADWDGDGDLDFFCELGGAVPGDKSYNLLFQNPGHGRHWLKVKLVGTATNRAALGAKIKVELKSLDGSSRSIHRTIGNNSSFGGNSLVESIGLLDATLCRLTLDHLADQRDTTGLSRFGGRPIGHDYRGFRHGHVDPKAVRGPGGDRCDHHPLISLAKDGTTGHSRQLQLLPVSPPVASRGGRVTHSRWHTHSRCPGCAATLRGRARKLIRELSVPSC